MILLTCNDGQKTIISDEDWDLCLYTWNTAGRSKDKVYRTESTGGKKKVIWLAREIASRIKLCLVNQIDHIDRNSLNNQRNNLRSATNSQNQMNIQLKCNNTTGYKGVHYNKRQKNYTAQIYLNGIKIYLGCYNTPEEAAKAYDKKAEELFGDFACLNNEREESNG